MSRPQPQGPTSWRLKMLRSPHADVLLALAANYLHALAGLGNEVLHCYPTPLGFEIYLKKDIDASTLKTLLLKINLTPGFLGARVDSHEYVTLAFWCLHYGQQLPSSQPLPGPYSCSCGHPDSTHDEYENVRGKAGCTSCWACKDHYDREEHHASLTESN